MSVKQIDPSELIWERQWLVRNRISFAFVSSMFFLSRIADKYFSRNLARNNTWIIGEDWKITKYMYNYVLIRGIFWNYYNISIYNAKVGIWNCNVILLNLFNIFLTIVFERSLQDDDTVVRILETNWAKLFFPLILGLIFRGQVDSNIVFYYNLFF